MKGMGPGASPTTVTLQDPVKRHAYYSKLRDRIQQWRWEYRTPFRMILLEKPNCPYCGSVLKFEDHVLRHRKIEGGIKEWFLIERRSCPAGCGLQRVLAAFLSPYKHYDIDIITGVLDGTVSPEQKEFEDYPCEKTMERWKAWMALNLIYINAYLKSVGVRLFAMGIALAYSMANIVDEIKQRDGFDWLRTIIRAVYNTSGSLEPYRDPSG